MYGLILAASTMAPLQGFWNFVVYARPRYFNSKGMTLLMSSIRSARTNFLMRLSTKSTNDENRTHTTATHRGHNSDGTSPSNNSDKRSSPAIDNSIVIASEVVPFDAPDSPGETGDATGDVLNLIDGKASFDVQAIPEDSTLNPADETRNDEPNYVPQEPVANQDDLIDDNDARFEMMLAG